MNRVLSAFTLRSALLCLKLAFRELLGHKKFSFFLIVNLSLGLLSFLIIDTVQVSVQDYVLENSRKISLADITVTTKRVVTSEELDILATHSNIERSTKTSEYFTMARAKEDSRQVQPMIFDEAFPLYGTMKITDTQGNAVSWAEASQKMQESRIVAISKEMQYAFSTTALSANEPIKIGEEEFQVG